MIALPPISDAAALAIADLCEREISRRRTLVVRPWEEEERRRFCHLLTDVRHEALCILSGHDRHDELRELLDEADYPPLWAASGKETPA